MKKYKILFRFFNKDGFRSFREIGLDFVLL